MARSDADHDAPHPEMPIRRFDVFVEYARLERLEKGDARDVAKSYGVWLAKVVAWRTGPMRRHSRASTGCAAVRSSWVGCVTVLVASPRTGGR